MKVIHKGAIGVPAPREFWCAPCDAWFTAYTKRTPDDAKWESRTHSCGRLCDTRIKPGSKIAIRGQESNAIPRDHRKAWQQYWKLTDNQMQHVTREEMDRVMREKGISFVDKSWDDNVNGGKRERGEAVELPPDTDNPREVEEWNAKKYGPDFVQNQKEQIRSVFEAAQAGTLEKLPEADDAAAHSTPHIIDPDKVRQQIAAEPVVETERKREIAGRIVTT